MDQKNTSIELDQDEIPESDIQFDCPYCGKHLSIDPRGAGLVIVCPDCEKHVSVPIPDGLDIEDIDATKLETFITALNNLEQTQASATAIQNYLEALLP